MDLFPKCASLAQSVERETLNLKVAGSTPAWGFVLFLFRELHVVCDFCFWPEREEEEVGAGCLLQPRRASSAGLRQTLTCM
jgi:hypothetical protein